MNIINLTYLLSQALAVERIVLYSILIQIIRSHSIRSCLEHMFESWVWARMNLGS